MDFCSPTDFGRKVKLEKMSRVLRALGITVPLIFLGVLFFYPVFQLLSLGLGGSQGKSGFGSEIWRVLAQTETRQAIWQTLFLAGAGTVVSIILGIPIAYILYCLKFPGRIALRALVSLPFVLPTIGVATAFKTLLGEGGWLAGLGWQGHWPAIVLAMAFYNTSVVSRTVGSTWCRLDDRPVQAARVLGANHWQAFSTIILPQLAGAVGGAASLVFLYCCAAYALVRVLGGVNVITLESHIYTTTSVYLDLPAAAVLSFLQVVIVGLSLALSHYCQNRAVKRQIVRATPWAITPTNLWTKSVLLGGIVLIILLIALPISQLVARSLQREGQWTLANYTDLFLPQVTRLYDQPIINSLWISLAASWKGALIAVMIGTLVAYYTARAQKNRGLWNTYDALFMLPLGVSSVTVGLGFLITLAAPPWDLAESAWLLPLAQALVAVPLVIRVIKPLLSAIDERQREAAGSLGATNGQVWATIDWPIIRQSLLVAGGFAFAVCFGEFGAASFLVLPEKSSLPVVIYRLAATPGAVENGMAMAATVILCTVCAGLMTLVEYLPVHSGQMNRRKDRTNVKN